MSEVTKKKIAKILKIINKYNHVRSMFKIYDRVKNGNNINQKDERMSKNITLQEVIDVFEELVKVNEDHNATWIKILGKPAGWNDLYLDKSRDVIKRAKTAISNGHLCCGGMSCKGKQS